MEKSYCFTCDAGRREEGQPREPNDASAWFDQAISSSPQEAVEICRNALLIYPDSVDLWSLLGLRLLEDLCGYEEALDSFDQALDIAPEGKKDWLWHHRGQALYYLGRYQEAVESYEKVSKPYDEDREFWEDKNKALDKLEDWYRERRPSALYRQIWEDVSAVEARLYLFIRQKLTTELGDEDAWYKGVPQSIREDCATRQQADIRHSEYWQYLMFGDLQRILGTNWESFTQDFERVKTSFPDDPPQWPFKKKGDFLDHLQHLNDVRNLVDHAPRMSHLTQEDRLFVRHMRKVIENFTGTE